MRAAAAGRAAPRASKVAAASLSAYSRRASPRSKPTPVAPPLLSGGARGEGTPSGEGACGGGGKRLLAASPEISGSEQRIVVPSRNSSMSGARAGCLPRRGRSRGAGHPLCSRPRATRARLAVPHPPASRQTRASRASRPRPRSAPPRRGEFRPRATRARSGSRPSRARRVPWTGGTAMTDHARECSCAIS